MLVHKIRSSPRSLQEMCGVSIKYGQKYAIWADRCKNHSYNGPNTTNYWIVETLTDFMNSKDIRDLSEIRDFRQSFTDLCVYAKTVCALDSYLFDKFRPMAKSFYELVLGAPEGKLIEKIEETPPEPPEESVPKSHLKVNKKIMQQGRKKFLAQAGREACDRMASKSFYTNADGALYLMSLAVDRDFSGNLEKVPNGDALMAAFAENVEESSLKATTKKRYLNYGKRIIREGLLLSLS